MGVEDVINKIKNYPTSLLSDRARQDLIQYAMDYIQAENNWTRAEFNLEEILEFQTKHKVEVLVQSDYQYHCFIDFKEGDGSYAQAFTVLNALMMGIRNYKQKLEEDEYR